MNENCFVWIYCTVQLLCFYFLLLLYFKYSLSFLCCSAIFCNVVLILTIIPGWTIRGWPCFGIPLISLPLQLLNLDPVYLVHPPLLQIAVMFVTKNAQPLFRKDLWGEWKHGGSCGRRSTFWCFSIDRSSKRLWAASTRCTTPPVEQGGRSKTRQASRTTSRSWTTCWASWGTDGTLCAANQSRGKGAPITPPRLPTPHTPHPHPTGCCWLSLSLPCRQNKLEEALLFSGQFTDALQALIDWLYRVEPQLAEDQPVHGDIDLVLNLIDSHKVRQTTKHSAANEIVVTKSYINTTFLLIFSLWLRFMLQQSVVGSPRQK